MLAPVKHEEGATKVLGFHMMTVPVEKVLYVLNAQFQQDMMMLQQKWETAGIASNVLMYSREGRSRRMCTMMVRRMRAVMRKHEARR